MILIAMEISEQSLEVCKTRIEGTEFDSVKKIFCCVIFSITIIIKIPILQVQIKLIENNWGSSCEFSAELLYTTDRRSLRGI